MRILRNAGHYSCSPDALRGFAVALDRFVEEAFRDWDDPPDQKPLGAHTARSELIDALKNPVNRCMPKLPVDAEREFVQLGVTWKTAQEKVMRGEGLWERQTNSL